MCAEIYFLYVVINICDMLIVFYFILLLLFFWRSGEQQKSMP